MSNIISPVAKLFTANSTITKGAVLANARKSKESTHSDATFKIKPNKLHKLDKGPATSIKLTAEEAMKIYEDFVVARTLEEAASALYKKRDGGSGSFCHVLHKGQEAVAVGMKAVMRDVDTVMTSYRCHTWTYLMGSTVMGVLAELTGRKPFRSKEESMHMYQKNFHGGNGMVGGQVPLGAGVAFAHKYTGDGGVNFALYGEGAANQGQIFEAYNIAKLWNLPCVFVCENNRYCTDTADSHSSTSRDYYRRGGFIPGFMVDGMNVFATMEATRFCIDWCTGGKGPLVMEMETYRYCEPSMSEPGISYDAREEIQKLRQNRDPIKFFKEQILINKLATHKQLMEVDIRVKKMVDEAAALADSDSEIGLEVA